MQDNDKEVIIVNEQVAQDFFEFWLDKKWTWWISHRCKAWSSESFPLALNQYFKLHHRVQRGSKKCYMLVHKYIPVDMMAPFSQSDYFFWKDINR